MGWTRTFGLPPNDERYLNATYEELAQWQYEDAFHREPLLAYTRDDGSIVFEGTGDELFDEWEAAVARGETPDLDRNLNEELRGVQMREQAEARMRREGMGMEPDVQEDDGALSELDAILREAGVAPQRRASPAWRDAVAKASGRGQ